MAYMLAYMKFHLKCGNMEACGMVRQSLVQVCFEYDTAKIVHIKSKRVGLINRFIQLVIICYVIGYVIIYNKGYQEFEKPYSSVTTKVKGTSLTNLTGQDLPLYGGLYVWDSADYIIPPEENGVFFVMTNMIITPNQTQGRCPEDPKIPGAKCKTDSDCKAMQPIPSGHGIKTGRCVAANRESTSHVCEIYSWCPVEIEGLPMPGFNISKTVPLLDATKNFTVLIKNSVQFPKFNESKRNIKQVNDKDYLKNCNYDPKQDHLCPVFKLGEIVKLAGVDYEEIAYKGGIIGIIITWNCNFDSLSYSCGPEYSFRRLDNANAPIAPGYNFRYSNNYVQNNKLYRVLTKAYGIRFVIMVYGEGGKFNVVPLFLNIGSGLALLGIATVLCDIVVLYLLQKKYFYREKKYLLVNDPGAENENWKELGRSGESGLKSSQEESVPDVSSRARDTPTMQYNQFDNEK